MKAEKFPLTWPDGFPITQDRKRSKFDCTMPEARDGINYQLRNLGVKQFILSTNVQRNSKGELVAGKLVYPNPGAALYFIYKGEEKVIACDKWLSLHENLRAIERSLEAIRGLERWGCSDIVNRAIGEMKQLAPAAKDRWPEILGVDPHFATPDEVKAAHRRLSKLYHPDTGTEPSAEKFQAVQEAFNSIPKQKS